MLALDGVENFLATAAKKFEIDGQGCIHFFDQRKASPEPVAGPVYFELHHVAKGRGIEILRQIFLGDRVLAQVFVRQIDSAFGVVDGYILPEVRQLECGASVIGKLLALGILITAKVEHKMADRVRGVTAVGQDVVESFEPGDTLILAEGDEEVGEFMLRDRKLFDGLSQGDESGMSRIAVVAGIEFGLPLIE